MNKVILMGRLTKDPEVRYTQGEHSTLIARYTLAVDRKVKSNNESADFINCICFSKIAEITEKYLRKGTKVVITGRIQTGSYVNKSGNKVYTTDIVVEEQEFAESKAAATGNQGVSNDPSTGHIPSGFMDIPDGMDEELPFN